MSQTSTKLELPNVTLICVDSRTDGLHKSIKAVERCKELVNFGSVKMLTHLDTDYEHKVDCPNISSHIMYSCFMLKEIYKYVNTKFMLTVQADGWILNANAWDDKWYQYDYIGALFNQYDIVGNGGFSFRSKALMEFISGNCKKWDISEEGANKLQKTLTCYEDGVISMSMTEQMNRKGFHVAPPNEACKFAQGGNPNEKYYYSHPFGFHGSWRQINIDTGYVYPEIKNDGQLPELL